MPGRQSRLGCHVLKVDFREWEVQLHIRGSATYAMRNCHTLAKHFQSRLNAQHGEERKVQPKMNSFHLTSIRNLASDFPVSPVEGGLQGAGSGNQLPTRRFATTVAS